MNPPKSIHLIDVYIQKDYLKDGVVFILRLAMKPEGCPPLPKNVAPKEDFLQMVQLQSNIVQYHKDNDPVTDNIKKFIVPIRTIKVFVDYKETVYGDGLTEHLASLITGEVRNCIESNYPSDILSYPSWVDFYYQLKAKFLAQTNWSSGGHKYALGDSNTSGFSTLSRTLPGVDSLVTCPVLTCVQERQLRKSSLWGVVQHVNDYHKWSIDSIADWLDKLHDDGEIDIAFKEKP